MKIRTLIGIVIGLVLVNIPVQWVVARWDLTEDKRYTLSEPMKELIGSLSSPLEITLYLDGELNPGFHRLQQAVEDFVAELDMYGDVQLLAGNTDDKALKTCTPTVIHERSKDGRTIQTTIYPYAQLKYGERSMMINLLKNQRGKSGEENLNQSIEGLEYAFAEVIHAISKQEVERIAFLEGHGEWSEHEVFDWSQSLSRYFQIDRGILGTEKGVLDGYKAVIIANPQQAFSETDKYILDQYLMQGVRIMWLLNGVQFSSDMLSHQGTTPIIALDLNLTDILFRYGVRINPMLVQDMQCLPIPVDVSQDPNQPNFQPIPWTYAPLLLTSQNSSITRNVMQVSSTFASSIDFVGEEDGLYKEVLLATSSASRITGTPAEVDLTDLTILPEMFQYAYIPVGASIEGSFPSFYAHRMPPAEISNLDNTIKQSVATKQIVVACGSMARNEWQNGSPLPVGYDRYTRTQFGNQDFLTNAILYLTDDQGLIHLRQKSIVLRLLNDKEAYANRTLIQMISIVTPILILCIIGLLVWCIRRYQYSKWNRPTLVQ
jgi:ABC-2 type transport system permease protein